MLGAVGLGAVVLGAGALGATVLGSVMLGAGGAIGATVLGVWAACGIMTIDDITTLLNPSGGQVAAFAGVVADVENMIVSPDVLA